MIRDIPEELGLMRVLVHVMTKEQTKIFNSDGNVPPDEDMASAHAWIDVARVATYGESGAYPGQTEVAGSGFSLVALMGLSEFHKEFCRVRAIHLNAIHKGGGDD